MKVELIEAWLQTYKTWLEELPESTLISLDASLRQQAPDDAPYRSIPTPFSLTAYPAHCEPTVTLRDLLREMIALKHEVHLQTRSTRSLIDATEDALKTWKHVTVKPSAETASIEAPWAHDVSTLSSSEEQQATLQCIELLCDLADNFRLALEQCQNVQCWSQEIRGLQNEEQRSPKPRRRRWWPWWGKLEPVPAKPTPATVPETDEATLMASLIEGYSLSKQRIIQALENNFQVYTVAEVGERFNPEWHEALGWETTDAYPHNHICKLLRAGYTRKGKLLRTARVYLARSPETATVKK